METDSLWSASVKFIRDSSSLQIWASTRIMGDYSLQQMSVSRKAAIQMASRLKKVRRLAAM